MSSDNIPAATQSYQKDEGAGNYLKFIDGEDGATFKKVLGDAVLGRLDKNQALKILDAGCGPGWLSYLLAADGHNVEAFDSSPQLISVAKSRYPKTNFQIADLTGTLPYSDGQFDVAILSMAALDLHDQTAAFKNLFRVLKPGGQLIITTVNPYYGFPVGVWKRGLWRFLFRKTPKLKLREYQTFVKNPDRKFIWGKNLVSYFYTLPEQINTIIKSGFKLEHMQDIVSSDDNKKYSLKHTLYRFPIFILLEFKKI